MSNLQDNQLQDQDNQHNVVSTGANNATILYPESESLEPVEELDTPETNDLDDLPELDPLDDPLEPSADFKEQFKEHFGIEVEAASEILAEIIQERQQREVLDQKYELSAIWEVPVAEVDRRLALVTERWSKMTPQEQQRYDSVQGAVVIYKSLQSRDKGIQSSTKKSPTAVSKYDYTQRQIDAMTPQERQAQDSKILLAYAQGRVQGARR